MSPVTRLVTLDDALNIAGRWQDHLMYQALNTELTTA